MIVGISGLAGSGKDTVANMLLEKVPGARKIAFAEPMKRFVSELYDWPLEKLEDYEFKETPDPRYVRLSRARVLNMCRSSPNDGVALYEHLGLTEYEYSDWVVSAGVHLTPRRALQQLGTDWGRNCYENTWVDYAMRRARTLQDAGCPLVLITDVRFQNEADAIRAAGGIIIAVERPGVAKGAHASEQGCGVVDATVKNDSSLDLLHTRVCQFLLNLVEGGRLPESAVSSSAWPDLTRACLAAE